MVKLPAYIVAELMNRLVQDHPRRKFDPILKSMNLSLEDPDPAPDFEYLSESFEDDCTVGSLILPAELKLGTCSTELHLRISYALPSETDVIGQIHGATAQVDILSWEEGQPDRPRWQNIGLNTLGEAMIEEIWDEIMWNGEREETRGTEH